jgi:hypothetical protein
MAFPRRSTRRLVARSGVGLRGVPLGLLRNPPEEALELGAGFLGADLAGHLDKALRLRRIVGFRLGFAGHASDYIKNQLFRSQR